MSGKKPLHTNDEIIRIAGAAGAKAALEMFEKEKKKAEEERKSWKRKNTRLLLRNYRTLKAHCEKAVYRASQVEEDGIGVDYELLMSQRYYDEDMIISSIMQSAERTYIIMRHVDEILKAYETMCINSSISEEIRRYEVIYYYYLAEEPKIIREIAEIVNLSERAVFKDIKAAIEKLSVLLFGSDILEKLFDEFDSLIDDLGEET